MKAPPTHWTTLKKLIYLKAARGSSPSWVWQLLAGTAPLQLLDAVAHPIHSLTQYGLCVQDGTPTPDAPVDILCNNGALKYSANMANVNEQTASVGYYINASGAVLADIYNWFYQSFIPVKPNTTYTLSMSSPVYYVTISEYSTAADSGFIIRKAGKTGGNSSLTITTEANTNFIRFGANLNRVVVSMEMVLGINWMLNLGGTAMEYQPYVEGGIYTDGTGETLTISGENLFDASSYTEINAYVNANTGVLTAGSPGSMTQYCAVIPCKPNTQYNITGQGTSAWGAFTSDSIGTTATATTKGGNLTTGADDRYLIGLVRANGDSIDYRNTLVVQEAQTVSVPMLLGVGDYKDEAEIISGLLTHKVGMYVITGDESGWGTSSTAGIYTLAVGFGKGLVAICTHFAKVSNATSAANMSDGTFKGHSTNTVVYFKDSSAETLDAFKAKARSAYASGNPWVIVYALATSTTEQTTPHALHTTAGTNVVDVTAAVSPVQLSVEYAKQSA